MISCFVISTFVSLQSATYVFGYVVGFNLIEGYEGFVIHLSMLLLQIFLHIFSVSIFCESQFVIVISVHH